jgi:hypothetical protein
MAETEPEPNERYKVGQVVAEYGLAELHRELPDRWLGDGREAQSLRDLAADVNTAVLRAAMQSAGLQPLDGEVENAYRLLTGDDVSSGMRTAKRNELARDGVDVDAVEADFVTHQAVHTYLTEALDVSKRDQDDVDPVDKHAERVNRLRSRTEAVAADSLDSLADDGAIEVGDPDVSVTIQVYCDQCNRQHSLSSLLTAGGCDCAD